MKSERISPFWVNGYQPFSAMVTYTSKELLMCLDIMEKLEAVINRLEEPVDVTTL